MVHQYGKEPLDILQGQLIAVTSAAKDDTLVGATSTEKLLESIVDPAMGVLLDVDSGGGIGATNGLGDGLADPEAPTFC